MNFINEWSRVWTQDWPRSVFMPPPAIAEPEALWFRVVRTSVRTYIRTSGRRLLTWYLKNALMESRQIWLKWPLGLKGELIKFWWPKVRVTVISPTPFSTLLTRYLRNTLMESRQIWLKWPLGLKGELITFWWLKVKGQGHCDLRYFGKALMESHQICLKWQLGLKGELERAGWRKGCTSQNTHACRPHISFITALESAH